MTKIFESDIEQFVVELLNIQGYEYVSPEKMEEGRGELTHRAFTEEDIKKVTETFHKWQKKEAHEDEKGFCKSASVEDVRKNNYILTPGRYVGIPDEEDDGIPFETKMKELTEELSKQMEKEKELNEEIKKQLEKVGFKVD